MSKELLQNLYNRFYQNYSRRYLTSIQCDQINLEFKHKKITMCGRVWNVSKDKLMNQSKYKLLLKNKVSIKHSLEYGNFETITLNIDAECYFDPKIIDPLTLNSNELVEVEGNIESAWTIFDHEMKVVMHASSIKKIKFDWLTVEFLNIKKNYYTKTYTDDSEADSWFFYLKLFIMILVAIFVLLRIFNII